MACRNKFFALKCDVDIILEGVRMRVYERAPTGNNFSIFLQFLIRIIPAAIDGSSIVLLSGGSSRASRASLLVNCRSVSTLIALRLR